MPGQDLIEPPGHEVGILARDGAVLNNVRHAGKGLPEVATIGAALQQRRHRGIDIFQMSSELGSVHARSIGVAVSPLETNVRKLCSMDENQTLSLFEQLQYRVASAVDRWSVAEQFEAELLAQYPADATEIIELMTHWLNRLGLIEADQLIGFV
nr:hypothetical protein [Xanthomonas arboricola]